MTISLLQYFELVKKIVCTWLQQVIQAQKIIILFFYLAKARPCLSKWMKRWSIFLLWIDYERMSVFVFMRVEENKKKSLAATTLDKNIDVPMDVSHFNPVFNKKCFLFHETLCLQVAEKIMPCKKAALQQQN